MRQRAGRRKAPALFFCSVRHSGLKGFCVAGFVAMMPRMDPILDDHGLAQLLKATDKMLNVLLERTDLPRFTLAGERRYLANSVLSWVARHEGSELIPLVQVEIAPEPEIFVTVAAEVTEPAPQPRPRPVLMAAAMGETSWLDADAIGALAEGAGEAGRNLDRLKLRDSLLELNDALLPLLIRYSEGRLHPHHDEKLRTSPWRLDLGSSDRIETIGIAWGAGEHAPPAFSDRPHVEVVLSATTLSVRLDNHGRAFQPPLETEQRMALLADGFELGGERDAIARTYTLPQPAPTLDTVAQTIHGDLARLVPLWVRLV